MLYGPESKSAVHRSAQAVAALNLLLAVQGMSYEQKTNPRGSNYKD